MSQWINRKLATKAADEELEPGVILMDVRDLSDESNDPMRIVPKIIMGDYIIREGNRLVIQCLSGHNRSNVIASCIVAYQMNTSLDEAMRIVKAKVPRMNAHPRFVQSATPALDFLKRNLGYN